MKTAEIRKTIETEPVPSRFFYVGLARNGEVTAVSSEMYGRRSDAERGAKDAFGSDVKIIYAEGVKS